jgi:3-deoxy-D-manno-octulosonate 8-phosphate phosphatase KdsC-like HAD superfamily phosphatase
MEILNLLARHYGKPLKQGGNGAVREVAELILEAQGKLKPLLEAYQ